MDDQLARVLQEELHKAIQTGANIGIRTTCGCLLFEVEKKPDMTREELVALIQQFSTAAEKP